MFEMFATFYLYGVIGVFFLVYLGGMFIYRMNWIISGALALVISSVLAFPISFIQDKVDEAREKKRDEEIQRAMSAEPREEREKNETVYEEETSISAKEEDVTSNEELAAGLVEGYVHSLTDAINEGDFAEVEPFLLKDGVIYPQQKELVYKLSSQQIKETVVTVQIDSVTQIGPQAYDVASNETITIESGGSSETKNYRWIYTVEKAEGELFIREMRKNE